MWMTFYKIGRLNRKKFSGFLILIILSIFNVLLTAGKWIEHLNYLKTDI